MIHHEDYLMEWYKRVNKLYDVSIDDLETGNAKEIAIANYYDNSWKNQSYDADFIVLERSKMTEMPMKEYIEYQSGNWILLKNLPLWICWIGLIKILL